MLGEEYFLLKLWDDETFRTGRRGKWRNYKLPTKELYSREVGRDGAKTSYK